MATNSSDIYAAASAYHNCGRSIDEGASLNINATAGGDLRITEFVSALIETMLDNGDIVQINEREFVLMHRQPVFTSEYFRKMTGHNIPYSDVGLENAIRVAEKYKESKL